MSLSFYVFTVPVLHSFTRIMYSCKTNTPRDENTLICHVIIIMYDKFTMLYSCLLTVLMMKHSSTLETSTERGCDSRWQRHGREPNAWCFERELVKLILMTILHVEFCVSIREALSLSQQACHFLESVVDVNR
jgi:Ca2+/H+ antiporter